MYLHRLFLLSIRYLSSLRSLDRCMDWALILRAQLMLRFTDTYGPLPVGLEEDANAYSSQETIYNHLIKTLDQALDIINPLLETNPKSGAQSRS